MISISFEYQNQMTRIHNKYTHTKTGDENLKYFLFFGSETKSNTILFFILSTILI